MPAESRIFFFSFLRWELSSFSRILITPYLNVAYDYFIVCSQMSSVNIIFWAVYKLTLVFYLNYKDILGLFEFDDFYML